MYVCVYIYIYIIHTIYKHAAPAVAPTPPLVVVSVLPRGRPTRNASRSNDPKVMQERLVRA